MPELTLATSTTRAEATIFRPIAGPVRLKIPYANDNRAWISGLGIRAAKWNKDRGYWELPRTSWHKTLAGLCARFDPVRDVRDNHVNTRVVCNVKCQTAAGPDCECSCGGQYHQTAAGGGARG